MNHQRGHVDTGQVLAKVLMPGRDASQTGRSRGAGRNVPAGLDRLLADAFAQQQIRVVKILEKLREETVTICGNGFLYSLEDAAVHALRVVRRLQKERRDSRDEYCLTHPFRSVLS